MEKLALRSTKQKEWQMIDRKKYEGEPHLETMLLNNPELIPMGDLDLPSLKVVISQTGLPGAGKTDLIGVDENGEIAIIECKLANNRGIKREVIGQVLDYAAHIWQMTYDEFDELIKKNKRRPLIELIKDIISAPDWSEENFKKNIEDNLKSGRFHLLIACDTLDHELKTIIEYLNSGNKFFEIYALEVKYFANNEFDIVAPRIFGEVPTPSASGKIDWSPLWEDIEDRLKKSLPKEFRDHSRERGSKGYSSLVIRYDTLYFYIGVEASEFCVQCWALTPDFKKEDPVLSQKLKSYVENEETQRRILYSLGFQADNFYFHGKQPGVVIAKETTKPEDITEEMRKRGVTTLIKWIEDIKPKFDEWQRQQGRG